MNVTQIKKILANYLSGTASRKEKVLLDTWLDKAWEEKEMPADSEAQRIAVLENIRYTIALESADTTVRWYRNPRLAAAACLVVVMGAAMGHLFRYALLDWLDPIPMQKVTALKYQVKKVMLPDSSVVVLNGGSELLYPRYFRGNKRQVHLNGEAFFDVTRHAEAAFIINGPTLHVQVLGTSFVVTDSSHIQTARVGVKTGRVVVSAEKGDFTGRQLGANEELVFHSASHEVHVATQEVNTEWTGKRLLFSESALSDVFREIEQVYQVKIVLADAAISQEKFTGAFDAEDTLDDILKVMAISYRLTMHRDKNGTIMIRH